VELLSLLASIAVAIGDLVYRVLPRSIRRYVDLDSSLGEMLAFSLGAVVLVSAIAALAALIAR